MTDHMSTGGFISSHTAYELDKRRRSHGDNDGQCRAAGPRRLDSAGSVEGASDLAAAPAVVGDVRSPRKGERQRRAILDGLARLLAHRPIDDLTVGQIATEAGVGRSGFYVYFETKYTALAILTSEIWTDLMHQLDAFARRADETVEDYMFRVGSATLQVWHAHDAVLIASVQSAPHDDRLATIWKSWNNRLADLLTEQVLLDRSMGRARPVTGDIPGLASALVECTVHMFYLDRLHKYDEAQTNQMFDTIRSIWVSCAWGVRPIAAR
ncbi:TetR/AcrR family transcriptional regulator [Nocardia salmonicida]|uniref:TetR/AcrR family transcriptional regulator n=1 Tax=Nocardia salmonicida TaxID=53431 RepID=UPI0033EB0407